MLKFLVAALLVTSAYGGTLPGGFKHFRDFERDARIVGGSEASIAEAPWQVGMLYGVTEGLSCGGSIIKANVILTASHCPYGTSPLSWKARAGSANRGSGGEVIEIIRNVLHPSYSPNAYDYDIALQFTARPFSINGNTISIGGLPSQGASLGDGTVTLITGWGATSEGSGGVQMLRKAFIPVVSRTLCANAYGGNIITNNMVCAGNYENGGLDACQGDSGGPMALNGVIYGVTSFGNGCARPRYPGVWSSVAAFRSWIDQNS